MSDSELQYILRASYSDNDIRVIRIGIYPKMLKEWCIRLSMVRYELEPLRLETDGFQFMMELYNGKSHGRGATGYYYESNHSGRLEVDTVYLDSWIKYFLNVIQTGSSFHDHFDMQFYSRKYMKKSNTMYLTLFMNA